MADGAKNPWDERYAGDEFFYGEAPNDFLRDRAGFFARGADVLCLAEGEGRNAVFLAELGLRVTGVDSCATGLEKARRLAGTRGVAVRTVTADLETWDPGEAAWDAVVSIWCHVPAAWRAQLHARMARALRPGGYVLFEHYHPRQVGRGTGGPSDSTMLLTLDELRRDFPGFTAFHAYEGERVVLEGKGHTGRSVVTQWFARKAG